MTCFKCKKRRCLKDSNECFDCKFAEPVVLPQKKWMPCLGGKASNCTGKMFTTPEHRICAQCTAIINFSNLTVGLPQSTMSNIGQLGNRRVRTGGISK